MRYQASNCRGWTRTRRRGCQWGMKRRPWRSQTKSLSSQLASPCSLAGPDQSVGDQDEGSVGEGNAFGLAELGVEDRPEAQLIEQGSDDKDRSPGGGIDDLGDGRIAGLTSEVSPEQPLELGQDLDEEVLAAEIGDDALFDLAVLAIGFDDADVFVEGAVLGANLDGPGIHDRLRVRSVGWSSLTWWPLQPLSRQIWHKARGIAGIIAV